MKTNIRKCVTTFTFEDNLMVRHRAGPDGRSYTHRCSLKVFEIVAHVFDETPPDGNGIGAPDIAKAEDLPFTQVDVAVGFLADRGIIDRRRRRNCPVSPCVHLDAMTEWHALRHAGGASGEEVRRTRFIQE